MCDYTIPLTGTEKIVVREKEYDWDGETFWSYDQKLWMGKEERILRGVRFRRSFFPFRSLFEGGRTRS
jgi:hypothetical protein